jgi:hypothetical protein
MKIVFAFAILASSGFAADAPASAQAVKELAASLSQPREKRAQIADAKLARIPLTKADAATAAKLLWDDHAKFIRDTRAEELKAKVIRVGEREMKFESVHFGTKENAPKDGRSLFISMHGGGGAPAELNDSQWQNQIQLARAYKPAEGIYVAPRAPTNSWKLWHEDHIDVLFARLIENLVVLENVNPNRVYIHGYSAGGDGVYQLAPRMADHWAAAAMMAGHPNSASPLGLRNVPFAIQVGENDSAFRRNKVAADWGKKLDDLQKDDPAGYAHFVELHAGKGHWMGLQDRKAIPWMEKFTRNPLPDRIAWHQDGVTHNRLYWLAVPTGIAKNGQEIVASRSGQTITLTAKDIPQITVLLNDTMLDLDKPVTIQSGGKTLVSVIMPRTIATIARTLEERRDPHLIFSAEVTVSP